MDHSVPGKATCLKIVDETSADINIVASDVYVLAGPIQSAGNQLHIRGVDRQVRLVGRPPERPRCVEDATGRL